MLSSDRNILELLALLDAHGIRELVLCPGSRNAGIVHSALNCGKFNCHPLTDERSAGFYAIGLTQATGKPSAVIVTSGSALANLYPAACEAYYQEIPLIFISADRPSEWIGQMDGQTMIQEGALGTKVPSVTLPQGDKNPWHANRLINEAILECTHRTCKPVHINIPVCEPIYDFNTKSLPDVRKIERLEGISYNRDLILERFRSCKRSILLAGQLPANIANTLDITKSGMTIVAENLSNLKPTDYINSYTVDWERMAPLDLVITIGGHLTDKRMKEWMRRNPPRQHWHISADGRIADLFCCQTLAIESDVKAFLSTMPLLGEPIKLPIKETIPSRIIDKQFRNLPAKAVVHLANSTAVRTAQLSTVSATVCCNRGINGIEGSMSTAVGYATANPGKSVFLVIGDLAFFYDQNALWNTNLPANLHIMLINNGGGAIFESLPLPDDSCSRRFIQGKHQTSAKAVAEEYGIRYMNGESNICDFITSTSTVILEINE